MIKCEIFSEYIGDVNAYNEKVKTFVNNISIQGHTFISINTIAYGQNLNRLRTEIIYRENQTRKVIFEKTSY